jgi:hypothetical protein
MGKWAKVLVLGTSIGLLGMPFLGKDATAGLKGSFPVHAGPTECSGSMGSARNSSNSVEYIECDIQNYPSNGGLAVCTARNAAGATYYCVATDDSLVAAVRGLTSDAWLLFQMNSSGDCTLLEVDVSSDNAPKSL